MTCDSCNDPTVVKLCNKCWDRFVGLDDVLALAPTIIEEIINELKDRRGLSQEWDMIDRDLQDEIRAEWITIIQKKVTELTDK